MIENHPALTPVESSALKWVLLCERYKMDPLTASVLDFTLKTELDPGRDR
jgi:hypothetical protein